MGYGGWDRALRIKISQKGVKILYGDRYKEQQAEYEILVTHIYNEEKIRL